MSAKSDQRWMSGQSHPDIVAIGDPTLRHNAKPVRDISEAAPIVQSMVALLRDLKGAGLAATQIGHDNRIVVVEVRTTDLFPDRPESPLYVMVNPIIVEASEETEEGWEGCFSIPGLMGRVVRHSRILTQYQRPDGTILREMFDGYLARVIQHEIDHLDGVVFLDRMTSMRTLTTVQNYLRFHHENSVS